MTNEAIAVQVPLAVCLELAYRRRNSVDTREPDDVVVFALKAWRGNRQGKSSGGYQWKELFLPDGSEIRTRFRATFYSARYLAWRDIWIRRGINECWTGAAM